MFLSLLFFLVAQMETLPSWAQAAMWGPTLVMLGMILAFLLRVRPSWEKIKLRELDVRELEGKVRGEEAAALVQLAGGLQSFSQTLKEIAVEQRRSTDVIEILQRANADHQDSISFHLRTQAEKLLRLEEHYVQSERTGQGAA